MQWILPQVFAHIYANKSITKLPQNIANEWEYELGPYIGGFTCIYITLMQIMSYYVLIFFTIFSPLAFSVSFGI